MSIKNGYAQSAERLPRLLSYLGQDPANPSLLKDAAIAAFEMRDYEKAAELIETRAKISLPNDELINIGGLIAMDQQRFSDAAAAFKGLIDSDPGNLGAALNLAWAEASLGHHEEALQLLADPVLAISPRAPALKVQMLHHLERYDDALACGQELAERYPDNLPLMAALATVALDADERGLARHYAERAGENPEGLAARGVLALGEQDLVAAEALLDRSIAARDSDPRAWIGKGLARLAAGDPRGGAVALDRGARLFNDHIGSWIASGWAHFVDGDLSLSRQSFERALAIDANFGETHGALAVLDVVSGDLNSARRRMEVALRLDRGAFGGLLAKTMLLDAAGHKQAAQALRAKALSTPIGSDGQTIAGAMAGLARSSSRRTTAGP